jgi:hypothetical protein
LLLLQVPLLGNEGTLKAYESWEAEQSKPQSLPVHVRSQYEKAQAAVQQRKSHEEALAPDKAANEELLAAYMSYIRLEQVCLNLLSKFTPMLCANRLLPNAHVPSVPRPCTYSAAVQF